MLLLAIFILSLMSIVNDQMMKIFFPCAPGARSTTSVSYNKSIKSPDAERLHVVGDSVWDLLAAGRKGALGVGMLSGGYGEEELHRAGAFRIYSDPEDMLLHLEQLGLPGQ
jgi:hypothetical protein